MKKLVAFLLAAMMLLSVSAFAEDGKKYEGVTIKYLGGYDYMFDKDGNMKNPADSGGPQYAAIKEFEAKTGAKVEFVSGDLAALIAAGEVPDLWYTNNKFPSHVAQGLIEPLDPEWVEKLGDKYGKYWLEAMNIGDDCYGMVSTWASLGALQYNMTKMQELGIKPPREYYLEGEWTWENFLKCMNECVIDADGDGILEYAGVARSNFNFIMLSVDIDENGQAVSLIDTEEMRTLHNLLYQGLQTGAVVDKVGLTNSNGTYPLARFWLTEPFAVGNGNTCAWIQDGDYIDAVPPPAMTEGEVAPFCVNFVYHLRPAGASQKDAKTVEATYELLDYIFECASEYMNVTSSGAYAQIGEGLTGDTEWTKWYIDARAAYIENANAALVELPEYDAEWIATLGEYFNSAPIYFRELTLTGVDQNGWSSTENLTLPTATFVAQYAPVHEAQVDAYNMLYVE